MYIIFLFWIHVQWERDRGCLVLLYIKPSVSGGRVWKSSIGSKCNSVKAYSFPSWWKSIYSQHTPANDLGLKRGITPYHGKSQPRSWLYFKNNSRFLRWNENLWIFSREEYKFFQTGLGVIFLILHPFDISKGRLTYLLEYLFWMMRFHKKQKPSTWRPCAYMSALSESLATPFSSNILAAQRHWSKTPRTF